MANLDELAAKYGGSSGDAAPDKYELLAKKFGGSGSVEAPKTSFLQDVGQGIGNLTAGAVRGAGSIGATILAPYDMAKDALNGKGLSLESNRERRQLMDDGLQTMGAQPDSMMYKGGKLGGEIAGTAGAGGLLANGARAIAPTLTASRFVAPVVDAIATSGMKAGGVTGLQSLLPRALGGTISGGVSAGAIDPETAGTGMAFGAALPAGLMAAGKMGSVIGSALRAPAQSAEVAGVVQSARNAGYVIPPTQANATLKNRLLEGLAGKISTAQNASAKNQLVTNQFGAKALGLPADTKLTPEVLDAVRKKAGGAYDAVSGSGNIQAPQSYIDALDDIAKPHLTAAAGFPNATPSPVLKLVDSLKSNSFDASSAIAKIKELRTASDDAFRAGNTDIARASKKAAGALEDTIEGHLQGLGTPELLNNFRDARTIIAKTYSVEKALNQVSGNVDARKLAAQLQKGKPLSGDLKTAAEFAARFPKAAQTTEAMGSLPQTSPLDWMAGSSLSMATMNPLGLLTVGARPAARALALSPMTQNRLIQNTGGGLLGNGADDLMQFGYKAAPAIFDR